MLQKCEWTNCWLRLLNMWSLQQISPCKSHGPTRVKGRVTSHLGPFLNRSGYWILILSCYLFIFVSDIVIHFSLILLSIFSLNVFVIVLWIDTFLLRVSTMGTCFWIIFWWSCSPCMNQHTFLYKHCLAFLNRCTISLYLNSLCLDIQVRYICTFIIFKYSIYWNKHWH